MFLRSKAYSWRVYWQFTILLCLKWVSKLLNFVIESFLSLSWWLFTHNKVFISILLSLIFYGDIWTLWGIFWRLKLRLFFWNLIWSFRSKQRLLCFYSTWSAHDVIYWFLQWLKRADLRASAWGNLPFWTQCQI